MATKKRAPRETEYDLDADEDEEAEGDNSPMALAVEILMTISVELGRIADALEGLAGPPKPVADEPAEDVKP
jgi:flagellar motor switch/type III secretory pathway protein FliN